MFCKPNGDPLQPQNVTWSVKYVLKKYGLHYMRPLHDQRHAHATLLLQADTHLKVVSERLGHSTIQITGDIYSHVAPTMQEQAAETIGNLLKPRGRRAEAKGSKTAVK